MAPQYYIIGGGIIGSAIARELALRNYGDISVLEKESELGMHASGRNSGVFHSGINQKPGSLKANVCIEGNKRARAYCKEYGVPLIECGTYVVGRAPSDIKPLFAVYLRGIRAGVEWLRIITKEELREHEPSVECMRALYSPHGALVDSRAFLSSVAAEAQRHGAQYVMNTEVHNIVQEGAKSRIITNHGEYIANHLINCAGLHADTIAHMMGVGLEYRIIPFRGDYRELKHVPINGMVYPVPDLRYPFLGVHLTRTMDGRVLAGPTATLSLGREAYNGTISVKETIDMLTTRNFWNLVTSKEFLKLTAHNAHVSLSPKAFVEEVQSLCPRVTAQDLVPAQSGIRAQMVDKQGRLLDDILVEFGEYSTHILNAVSPGMTGSLAFAEYVVDRMNQC